MRNNDLTDAFRKIRGQFTVSSDETPKGVPEKKKRTAKTGSSYDSFLSKYENLEESYMRFTTQDLCYFFRQKAEESGSRYVIANMKRDMGIFKRLRDNFSIQEILLMIEFVFSGDQTYLDVNRTQPTVLASNWVNKIYQDSIDWANDSYIDKKTVTNKNTTKREWHSSKKKTKIGEWD